MARVEPEAFAGKDVELVFVAAGVEEAQRVEELLENDGIDFLVELQPFLRRGLLTFGEFTGAGFIVIGGQAPLCRRLLAAHGFRKGIIPGSEEGD